MTEEQPETRREEQVIVYAEANGSLSGGPYWANTEAGRALVAGAGGPAGFVQSAGLPAEAA